MNSWGAIEAFCLSWGTSEHIWYTYTWYAALTCSYVGVLTEKGNIFVHAIFILYFKYAYACFWFWFWFWSLWYYVQKRWQRFRWSYSIHLYHLPYYLGLHIASWGFGAEMIYSSNFGFSSSASFFSPDDVTSGFTGSGGFFLSWGPFVQPCSQRQTAILHYHVALWGHCSHYSKGSARFLRQKSENMTISVQCKQNLRQCWGSLRSRWSSSCSRTIPAKGQTDMNLSHRRAADTTHDTCAVSLILPSAHRGIPALLGGRCTRLSQQKQSLIDLEPNIQDYEQCYLHRKLNEMKTNCGLVIIGILTVFKTALWEDWTHFKNSNCGKGPHICLCKTVSTLCRGTDCFFLEQDH